MIGQEKDDKGNRAASQQISLGNIVIPKNAYVARSSTGIAPNVEETAQIPDSCCGAAGSCGAM
ncbi:MAG: hypothetical protein JNM58_17900 [Xanthomonadaceae bacterium]|nr:hypothetical protein [Xanthomonadaceae bacterium]